MDTHGGGARGERWRSRVSRLEAMIASCTARYDTARDGAAKKRGTRGDGPRRSEVPAGGCDAALRTQARTRGTPRATASGMRARHRDTVDHAARQLGDVDAARRTQATTSSDARRTRRGGTPAELSKPTSRSPHSVRTARRWRYPPTTLRGLAGSDVANDRDSAAGGTRGLRRAQCETVAQGHTPHKRSA
jgi:hypothetical protein